MAFDGEHVWVTLYGVETVAKFRLDGRNVGNFRAGGLPRALAFDGQHIWVGNISENTISKMGLYGEVLDTVRIGTPDTSPSALVFDGESIWVAASLGNSVVKLDADGAVVGEYAVGRWPTAALVAGWQRLGDQLPRQFRFASGHGRHTN